MMISCGQPAGGGGLPGGRLNVIAGPGTTGLVQRLVATARCDGMAAWLEPGHRLSAAALAASGVALHERLVSCPPDCRLLSRAVALLAPTGAAELMVVDAPARASHDLQRLATLTRLGRAVLLVLAPPGMSLTAAADLQRTVQRTAWRQMATTLQLDEEPES